VKHPRERAGAKWGKGKNEWHSIVKVRNLNEKQKKQCELKSGDLET
jgi:hypothetical protein